MCNLFFVLKLVQFLSNYCFLILPLIFAGQPTDTSSSNSDSALPQSDTSSVETSSNNAKTVEISQTPDTSNGTLSNTNQNGDETEDTHKSKRLKMDKLVEDEGAQQESSQPEVTEGQEETMPETKDCNQKVEEAETESHLDKSLHKEDQSRVEPQSTAVTNSGDAKDNEKSTEQPSDPQENATKKEEMESIEEPKDAETKCKPDAGDMEVDSTSSSSEQANGDDTMDKKEESSVDKVVPSIDESNSNEPTESTSEPMDQN